MKISTVKSKFIFLLSVFCLLPLVMMFIKSFQGLDGSLTIEQYGRVLFQTEEFFMGFWNSVIYTAVIIAINLPVSLFAAYGFSQFKFRGRDILFWLYIVLMLMPFQATIVPQYLTLKALGILNTPNAIILPNVFSTFGTFLIAQYMRGLDKEVLEAARIDGVNEFNLLLRIVMPICRPILFALTVLLFINYWSMVEQPIVFISDRHLLPLSVLLNGSGIFSKIAFATGIIFTALPLLLYLFCYDALIQGIALTSTVKDRGGVKKTKKGEEDKPYKKWVGKLIISFFIAMLVLTLATQKVTHTMTAEVEVVKPHKGELRMINPQTGEEESLGYFPIIVPSPSVITEGSNNYVYLVVDEKSKRKRTQATKVKVTVSAANEKEYAISGAIPYNAKVIQYTSKPMMDGNYIRVLNRSDEDD